MDNPSPPPTATTTASDIKPKLELIPISNPNPNFNNRTSASPPKKIPPLPWTHQETISLIQSYQEKWYSLKKGQLKSSQWEEVSLAVAARCGFHVPSKSATQCRHKIEKLRKRYRADGLKPYPYSWQYFKLMDQMERGPLPVSATRLPVAVPVKYQRNANSVGDYNESDSEERDGGSYGGVEGKKNKLKSINNIVRGSEIGGSGSNISNRNVVSNRIGMIRNFGGGGGGVGESVRVMRGLRTPMNHKRKGYFQNDESDDEEEEEENDDDDDDEDEEEEMKEGVVGRELASEIMGFADRFLRMENEKIEMMRETERCRMQMEKKRMDMILEAQRQVVDTIERAFGAHKKVKMAQEI